jgi:fructosamine-3-kinase
MRQRSMTLVQTIADAIAESRGIAFAADALTPVGGGDIHQAYRIGSDAQRYFVKVNRAGCLPMFEAEADALRTLAAMQCVRVPLAVCSGTTAEHAFLVLEPLDLHGTGDAARLGEQLAQLHRVSQTTFGWTHDNWIGSTPQPNAWQPDWIAFWREQRLGFQFALAARNGYGGALQRDGNRLMDRLDALFDGHAPTPSLLHGDLWGGNHGYLADGTPVVFDPALYVGDRECDLAMSELFGGFAPDFYAAYRASWPLDPGYATRKTLYNLYHILNHVNLFGGGYVAQATRMTAALLAQLR